MSIIKLLEVISIMLVLMVVPWKFERKVYDYEFQRFKIKEKSLEMTKKYIKNENDIFI